MKRKSILVLAYSISPVRGSEYSVGWNYVKEMSQSNDLIVLYGLAGDHMGDVTEVEDTAICQNMPNVRFIAVQPTLIMNLLNALNRKGILVYTFYLAYRFWHKQAYKVARNIFENQPIDLIHYLCPIGFREPGFLWKINKPYIWGPIGGVKNRPVKFMLQKNISSGVKAILYNIVNSFQFRFSRRVKSALKRTDLLFASTTETKQLIHDMHGIESVHLPENAITSEMLCNQRLVKVLPDECVNILWVGTIEERKSLDILLSALSLVKNSNWHLYIVGTGPLVNKHFILSEHFGLGNKITWAGRVTRDAVNQYYQKSHLHAITSMAEGNPTTIWEAMSFGIPTITLDHCGMHDTVCNKCGVRIPLASLDVTVKSYAANLERLISDSELITELSRGVLECSKRFSWSQRGIDWNGYYEAAIAIWLSRQHLVAD
jgi:glycosyltransferase involved in cell wall biosynthesis